MIKISRFRKFAPCGPLNLNWFYVATELVMFLVLVKAMALNTKRIKSTSNTKNYYKNI